MLINAIQHHWTFCRMVKTRALLTTFLLALSATLCTAQHWSFGLQPGGKRDVENLIESFQEVSLLQVDELLCFSES